MKKLFVHLSLLCLLAALLVPMVGCGRNDEGNTAVEETTGTTEMAPMEEPTPMDTGMGSDMGSGMGSDMGTMGTDMGTGMGTGTATPPAQ